ncbi:MAG: restriction endonuclease subunit S [Nostoc sp.]|uniref:restriction endonuclease subunit S n=1 Tax=Nostoc sp. TaxID=1180 RepID=UPI002FF85D9D
MNDGSVALLHIDYPLKLYLYYFLSSITKKLRSINQGAAQPNLNTGIVKNILVPLPSFIEQQQIVTEVERCLSIIDQLEKTIDTNIKRAEKLRQSILKQGFTGQLLPQDPNDEPAEKLLERIQAEKAKQVTTKTKKKTKSQPKSSTQLALPLD